MGQIGGLCPSCLYAVGWHRCCNPLKSWNDNTLKWKKDTLFSGEMDTQRALFNLHRRGLPLESMQNTAKQYVDGGYLTAEQAHRIMSVIEQERGLLRITGDPSSGAAESLDAPAIAPKLTHRELEAGGGQMKCPSSSRPLRRPRRPP